MKHIKICGIAVPVRTATEDEDDGLKKAYAYYDIEDGVIVLNKKLPANSDISFLTHEVLHAMLSSSGALRVTAATLGIDIDKTAGLKRMELWEELFIRVVTPHIVETFGGPKVSAR